MPPGIGRGRRSITSTDSVTAADQGITTDATSGTFSQNLTSAATLGSGFTYASYNSGSGVVTIDPAGTETIRSPAGTATTLTLAQGQGVVLQSDGTNWDAIASVGLAASPSASSTFRDNLFTITGNSDTTKQLVTQVDTQATGLTTTFDVGAQTGSYSFALPAVAGNETLSVLGTAQSVTATKTFTVRQLFGNGAHTADLTAILINRTITAAPNDHAIRDESTVTIGAGAGGYASYDARCTENGANTYDHLHAFQGRQRYSGSVSLLTLAGLWDEPDHGGSGTVTNRYGAWIKNPTGAGTITNNYGVYVDSLTRGSTLNYAFYSAGSTPSLLGGALQVSGAVSIGQTSANNYLGQGTAWAWSSTGLSSGTLRAGIYGDSSGNLNLFGGSSIAAQVAISNAGDITSSLAKTGDHFFTIRNTSAGTGDSASITCRNDSTAQYTLTTHSSGYTGTQFGITVANYSALLAFGAATNGLILGVSGQDKPVIFGINASEVARFTGGTLSAQQFAVKYTTDATSVTTGSITTLGGISWGVTKSAFGGGFFSTSPTLGIGYAAGAGGAVTQLTSRTTGVTLSKITGAITLFSAAGSATPATFTVTNTTVAAADTVHVVQKSGTDKYIILVTAVGAGTFDITFYTTGGTTTEQPVFNFTVMKGASS